MYVLLWSTTILLAKSANLLAHEKQRPWYYALLIRRHGLLLLCQPPPSALSPLFSLSSLSSLVSAWPTMPSPAGLLVLGLRSHRYAKKSGLVPPVDNLN
ncbi:hypothetical protein V8C37DRAFT_370938 [Trichoderma ceciliae]